MKQTVGWLWKVSTLYDLYLRSIHFSRTRTGVVVPCLSRVHATLCYNLLFRLNVGWSVCSLVGLPMNLYPFLGSGPKAEFSVFPSIANLVCFLFQYCLSILSLTFFDWIVFISDIRECQWSIKTNIEISVKVDIMSHFRQFSYLIIDIDECQSDPCKNRGECFNTVGSYHCRCPCGFIGKDCEGKSRTKQVCCWCWHKTCVSGLVVIKNDILYFF